MKHLNLPDPLLARNTTEPKPVPCYKTRRMQRGTFTRGPAVQYGSVMQRVIRANCNSNSPFPEIDLPQVFLWWFRAACSWRPEVDRAIKAPYVAGYRRLCYTLQRSTAHVASRLAQSKPYVKMPTDQCNSWQSTPCVQLATAWADRHDYCLLYVILVVGNFNVPIVNICSQKVYFGPFCDNGVSHLSFVARVVASQSNVSRASRSVFMPDRNEIFLRSHPNVRHINFRIGVRQII